MVICDWCREPKRERDYGVTLRLCYGCLDELHALRAKMHGQTTTPPLKSLGEVADPQSPD